MAMTPTFLTLGRTCGPATGTSSIRSGRWTNLFPIPRNKLIQPLPHRCPWRVAQHGAGFRNIGESRFHVRRRERQRLDCRLLAQQFAEDIDQVLQAGRVALAKIEYLIVERRVDRLCPRCTYSPATTNRRRTSARAFLCRSISRIYESPSPAVGAGRRP